MNVEKLKSILAKRGLKATNARIEVLELLNNQSYATPFQTIQSNLNKLDRVTLYRTIQALLEKGIIHKAFTDQNETYYALCRDAYSSESYPHNHVHFKCTNCNKVSCEDLKEVIKIALPNFQIHNTQINLTGICSNCA
jgi:Fur family ferric uptake transcriptional regulator